MPSVLYSSTSCPCYILYRFVCAGFDDCPAVGDLCGASPPNPAPPSSTSLSSPTPNSSSRSSHTSPNLSDLWLFPLEIADGFGCPPDELR